MDSITYGISSTTQYNSAEFPNAALVIARGGHSADFYVGLGTLNSRAKAVHFGFGEFGPATVFENNLWMQYGGNETLPGDSGKMRDADESIHLVFKYPSIGVGEVVQFKFVYILSDNVEMEALRSLELLILTQPTVSLSGNTSLISALASQVFSAVTFYVFGVLAATPNDPASWTHIGDSLSIEGSASYSLRFDSSLFVDGWVQVKVAGFFAQSLLPEAEASAPAIISNAGILMKFTLSDMNGRFEFYSSVTTMLNLTKVNNYDNDPISVSYYREIYNSSSMISTLLATVSTKPFVIAVTVKDLSFGQSVWIRASVLTLGGMTTSTVFSGVVIQLHQKPTNITLFPAESAENSIFGTLVGNLATSDYDAPKHFQYFLLDSANGAFAINGTQLYVIGPIDYETTPYLEIRIRTSNGQSINCCFEKAFVITILDVNEAPTALFPLMFSVPEDSRLGSIIGGLSGVDPDRGQVLSYFMLATSYSNFNVDSKSGHITLIRSLNFESINGYNVTIRVIDSGFPSLFLDKIITISVINVNEAPSKVLLVCDGIPCIVRDNTTVDSVIGKFEVIDEDLNDLHQFVLLESGDGIFRVDRDTGVLRLATLINYILTGNKLKITIRCSDSGGLFKDEDISVAVVHILQPPKVFDTVCSVRETRQVGDSVTVSANDVYSACSVDVLYPSAVYIFQIVHGAAKPGSEIADISVNSFSGIFFVNRSLDFTKCSFYNLTVAVSGDGGTSITNVIINIVNVDEPPVFHDCTFFVYENSPIGTIVGSPLSAFIFDARALEVCTLVSCGSMSFSISGGNDEKLFQISDSVSGQLSIASIGLDFEISRLFVLSVRAMRQNNLLATADITVIIRDVNEKPHIMFSSLNVFARIEERLPKGTQFGLGIYATDEDIGQFVTLEICGGNLDTTFALSTIMDVSSGLNFSYFSVSNESSLDYRIHKSFAIIICGYDNGIPILYDNGTYIIDVIRVNRPPNINNHFSFEVREDAVFGVSVGHKLIDFIADYQDSMNIIFTIVDYGQDLSRTFSIDRSTGLITVRLSILNVWLNPLYNYTIQVTDKNGLSVLVVVSIEVLDIPEAPIFESIFTGAVSENIPSVEHIYVSFAGQPIVCRATDKDIRNSLTFAIEDVDGNISNRALFLLEYMAQR